jgi:O-antigen/teichoic acid export membrane protein
VTASPVRNFWWSLAGTVVYSGCQWLTLSLLAKLGDRAMVGQFTLGLALTAPIVLCANLSLTTLQATDARRQFAFPEYLGLRLVTTAVALLPVAALSFGGGYGRTTALVLFLVGVSKAIDAVGDVFLGLLLQRERLDLSSRAMALNGSVSLAAIAVAMELTHSVVWAAVGTAFGSAVALFCAVLPAGVLVLREDAVRLGRPRAVAALLRPSFAVHRARKLAAQAAPLGVVGLLLSLNAAVPRYFLDRTWGEAELGVFSAVAAVSFLGTMVISALSQMASPRLARHYAEGDLRAFRRMLGRLLCLVLALGVAGLGGAALLGRPVLTLLYKPEYAERADVFVWLMAVAAVTYVLSMVGVAATAMRLFREQLWIHVGNVALSIPLCAWLVGRHGSLGAAWALLVQATLLTIAYATLDVVGLRRARAHPASPPPSGREGGGMGAPLASQPGGLDIR